MKIPGIIAKWLFMLCLPVLLLTASLGWAVNSSWLYRYGFDKYNVGHTAGLAQPELEKAADGLISYFNSGEEYISVTRLKGCPEKIVFQKHALPNALIPILTYAGLQTAMLMGGAMLTETTFSWPGLGRLMLFAVSYRDFNLIQGCVVFWALIISFMNCIVDILYAKVDPRVRY